MSTEPPHDDPPPTEHEFLEHRSGKDRRRGGERRATGRRYRRVGVQQDRRSGTDRRTGIPRRRIKDRRRIVDPRYKKYRHTSATSVYDASDVVRVQHMLSGVGRGTTCPVCEGPFTLGPLERRGSDSARQVWCAHCGRGTVVTNCVLARVMVVTRTAPIAKTLRSIFAGAGHEVVEPPDTAAALGVYRDNPADVVVMDSLTLAQTAGLELIRRLRAESSDPRIIVLAPRASYRMADPAAAALRLGASHVVRMPFTADDVLRVVKDARA
jgi:CheY-like chemotaxis protein